MLEIIPVPGPTNLRLDEVAHIHIPGRGRDLSGLDLSTISAERVDYAAEVYLSEDFAQRTGRIVCSGYKTPADTNGSSWAPYPEAEEPEWFIGVPEADSMAARLIRLGINPKVISIERHSIDTATNYVRSEQEGHFGIGDHRPVAIVAQEQQLERILKYIAGKTLRRDFMGIVVPELDKPDPDSVAAQLFTQYVLRGLTPQTQGAVEIADVRAQRGWNAMVTAQRLANRVKKGTPRTYNTG